MIFAVIFGLLAACAQKPETNSPEITKDKIGELRKAVPETFVQDLSGRVLRITRVSKERDAFTALGEDGDFRDYSITDFAKQVDEVIPSGHHNYQAFVHMFRDEAMEEVLRKADQYAFIVWRNGTIGLMTSDPTNHSGTILVRWIQSSNSERLQIKWAIKNIVRVIPTDSSEYAAYASKYCRNKKADEQ